MVVIKGQIRFQTAPKSIPDGSLLTVKFEDTSLADALSVNLGNYIKVINGYKVGDALEFQIECERPNCHVTTVSLCIYCLLYTSPSPRDS